nr:dihydrodipicolinate synthase family protein [uncultured Cupriavidus sp.]
MTYALNNRLHVALVLPLSGTGKPDEAGIRRLVQYFLRQPDFTKRGGLVANAEAGDVFYLTREEKRRVLEVIVDEVDGRVPVLAGTFGWTTADAVDVARDAKSVGASGIFVIPPGGAMDVTTSWDPARYPEVWLDQIRLQDRAVDLPIFTHPVGSPSNRYGIGLPVETTLHICAEVPNVVGWKMTYNYDGYRAVSHALKTQQPRVAVLGAAAQYFHENLATGNFDGTISGSWCYALEPMQAHIDAWERKDIEAANSIWNGGLRSLHDYIYSEWGRLHIRYKIAAWLRGLVDSPLMTAPMPLPRQQEVEDIHTRLVSMGLETRSLKDATEQLASLVRHHQS